MAADRMSELPADPIVARVCAEMQERSRVGLRKYCVGLDRTDLTPVQWLQHLREELMDALNYATRLQDEMEREGT